MSRIRQATKVKDTLPTLSVVFLVVAQISRIVYDEHPDQVGYLHITGSFQWLWDNYVLSSWWLWFVLSVVGIALLVADLLLTAKHKRTSTSTPRTLDDVYDLLLRIECQQRRLPPDTPE